MKNTEDTLAPMRPAQVVEPFQEQEDATGGNGQVMPEGQAYKGHEQYAATEKNRCNPDMAGACSDSEPPHHA